MTTVEFLTPRLRVRRWQDADLDALKAVYGDEDAMRWVGEGRPITADECARWFDVTRNNYANRGYGMFALESLEPLDGASVIGFAGLVHPGGQPEAEIKYALHRVHWGRGLASELVPYLLDYGARTHGLAYIIATVAPGNLASQRVVTKAGMTLARRRANADGSTTLVYEWHAPEAK